MWDTALKYLKAQSKHFQITATYHSFGIIVCLQYYVKLVMTSLIRISFMRLIWKDSVKTQIIGSSLEGFGIGAVSLE